MNEHVEIILHEEKKIFLSDYSGLKGDALTDTVSQHAAEHKENVRKGASQMLFLVDITDIVANRETISKFNELTKALKPYTKKSAVIGVTGIQKTLLRAVNLFSSLENKAFESKEDALHWLVEQ